jgi:uncharacterized membrane protein YkoI
MFKSILITVLALAIAAPVVSADAYSEVVKANTVFATITLEEARKIALEAVNGSIIKEEYESKRGRSVYEFYIRKNDGSVFEVYVDAGSGRVVKIESKYRS